MTWATVAWSNDFGLIEPVRVQNLIAWFEPAVMIAFAYVVLRVVLAVPRWTRRVLATRWPSFQRAMRRVIGVSIVVLVFGISGLSLLSLLGHPDHRFAQFAAIALAVVLIVSPLITPPGLLKMGLYSLDASIFVLGSVAIGLAGYYELFPSLPHALGGARAGWVTLRADQISPTMLARFEPPDARATREGEWIDMEVDILFRAAGTVYLRACGYDEPTDRPTVWPKRDVVRAAASCG